MKLTLTAEWTSPTLTASRIAIGGYTAVVEVVSSAYHFTVLRDHFEIVGTGDRSTRAAARDAAESMIALHAQALQAAV